MNGIAVVYLGFDRAFGVYLMTVGQYHVTRFKLISAGGKRFGAEQAE
jgi:hypothetical protein